MKHKNRYSSNFNYSRAYRTSFYTENSFFTSFRSLLSLVYHQFSISVYKMTVGTYVSQTKGSNFLRIAMFFYRKMMQLF